MADKVAILYDIENTSYKMLAFAIKQAKKISNNIIVVSDWDMHSANPRWKQFFTDKRISADQVERRSTGENSLDYALFDAALNLHRDGINKFIVVSSDSDFSEAAKLFSDRSAVYIMGIGGICSNKLLRKSYDRFLYYPPSIAQKIAHDRCIPSVEPVEQVRLCLIKAYQLAAQRTKWVTMPRLGQALKTLFPEFSFPKDHPHKLRDAVKIYHTSFEWKRDGNMILVKRKRQKYSSSQNPDLTL